MTNERPTLFAETVVRDGDVSVAGSTAATGGAVCVELDHPLYPRRLANLSDPPAPLWRRGPWQPAPLAVAVVGARAASLRGVELARSIGETLAQAGIDVISGGAFGVDAAAHSGVLAARQNGAAGSTVAVLGTGIDIVYPARHEALFAEIARTGALVTEFPPGFGPRRGAFPRRNRIIAALADLVVVVEASTQSGSLHTARAAKLLGRRLAVVPGSAGTDGLALCGAAVVRSAADVLAVARGEEPSRGPAPADPCTAGLYDALDGEPRDLGDLAFRTGLAINTCAAGIVELELAGLAARAEGGRYVRLR